MIARCIKLGVARLHIRVAECNFIYLWKVTIGYMSINHLHVPVVGRNLKILLGSGVSGDPSHST